MTTLYLKYRPQTIEDLDSAKVRDQLKALIDSGRLPHAFLFSGPKGTGKTSTARILAKIINCEKNEDKLGEPCNKCASCISITNGNNFDVIEMDAASNRGIDDIRNLKEKIMLSPGDSRKKIYIIDEVHMLTTEAFNALLKTLEEPPEHVVFILATTDPQKLPDTVKSRLTNIRFEKAKEEEIVNQLKKVVKGEKQKADDDTLELIAKASDGAFRDAAKILEQILINVGKLDKDKVEEFLFNNKDLTSAGLLTLISQGKLEESIASIEKFVSHGGTVKNLVNNMISDLHNLLLTKVGIGEKKYEFDFRQEQIQKLSKDLTSISVEINASPIAQLPLELVLIAFLKKTDENEHSDGEDEGSKSKKTKDVETKPKEAPPTKAKKVEAAPALEEQLEEISTMVNDSVAINLSESVDDATWFKILQGVRPKKPGVDGLLRAAKPFGVNDGVMTIGVYYRFHKEQLENLTNRKVLEEVICETLGANDIKVNFVLTERADKPSIATTLTAASLTSVADNNIIDAAKDIFGS